MLDTVLERVKTSLERAVEIELSTPANGTTVLDNLVTMDDTEVERVVLSVTIAVDCELNVVSTLPVTMMLLLLVRVDAISPRVSSADGALLIKLLIAVLIAMLLLLISEFRALNN